ncbi:MAG: hypothetical protein H0T40_15020 [Geodermatophilaceae bacterium]|nr:hypothetical protein [Geodermatophilaceae bacterium]
MTDVHADWRVVGFGNYAWFRAAAHVHAASLAGLIVDLLPDDFPLPDMDVRADGVRVGVSAPNERAGDTERAGVLMQAISDAAGTLGLASDPSVLQEMRLQVDSAAPASVKSFWRTALDYGDVDADTLADRLRRCPAIRFEQSNQTRPLRNRIHVDAGYPGPISDSVEALKAEGGGDTFTCEWYATLADLDGNEVDLVPGGVLGEVSTADWSVLFGAMACYPGVSPRQAAELAAAAARLADDAAIALMIDLRPEGVVFDSGKDQWEVAGFVDLAGAVQGAARAAGLTADNSRVRFVQAGIDAVDISSVREFWRAVLGYVHAPNSRITDLYDPRQLNPVVFFQPMDATEIERRRQRNRIHVELLMPSDQLQTRVDAAVAAGGQRLEEERSPDRYRLADPEGNEVVLRAVLVQQASSPAVAAAG